MMSTIFIVDIMQNSIAPTRRPRHTYSREFKTQVAIECAHPEASVASVALAHNLNANVVHRWIREHQRGTASVSLATPAFVPVALLARPMPQDPSSRNNEMRIEINRSSDSITVHWPVDAASDCATWLREWLK